jgi:hypothetical protein
MAGCTAGDREATESRDVFPDSVEEHMAQTLKRTVLESVISTDQGNSNNTGMMMNRVGGRK